MGGRPRSGRELRRKGPLRPPYDRVLIVCEGSKTEVNYLKEIAREARISTVSVQIIPSPNGTEPQQIVEGAEQEFHRTKGFEKVYVVFDRDQHRTYANAIGMAEARNGRLKNDEGKAVSFEAIVTVPCFELWFLLHFVSVMAPMHRDEAFRRVKQYLHNYEKGSTGTYAATATHLETATQRAAALKGRFSRVPGDEAYTDVHELVDV